MTRPYPPPPKFLQLRNLPTQFSWPYPSHSPRFARLLRRSSPHRMASSLQHSSQPLRFPSSGFKVIKPSIPVEEESIPNYKAERYYPVRIGEVFNKRYQVVGKLGYGSSSTVWLCRDLGDRRYIALKVYVNSSRVHRELPIYQRINQTQSNHSGRTCIRMLLDSFEILGPDGKHICLVHQPLGMSLHNLKMQAKGKVFSKEVLRVSIRQLLAALDFLHKHAQIIHTDLQPSNLLMGINDESLFSQYEQNELDNPTPRKILDGRTIYLSRPLPLSFRPPVLCDFGEARFGEGVHRDDIMPDVYRAPEVILGMKWTYSVDIWNVAMVVWDLFEHNNLFTGRSSDGKYDDGNHLAEMIAIIGPPPLDLLTQTENSVRYWDENGKWRDLAPIPEVNLELLEQRLVGEDKERFLQFIRKMLTWTPEERPSAEELIFDPWLMEGLFES